MKWKRKFEEVPVPSSNKNFQGKWSPSSRTALVALNQCVSNYYTPSSEAIVIEFQFLKSETRWAFKQINTSLGKKSPCLFH